MTQHPHHRNFLLKPPWPFWVAVGVGLIWGIVFAISPLWPSDIMPADSELNGPRWLLLLAPDQIVGSWFDGPVTAAGFMQRTAVLAIALGLIGSAALAGRSVVSAVPPVPDPSRVEQAVLAVVCGLAIQSWITVVVGLFGGIGSLWSGPLIVLLTLGIGFAAGRLGSRFGQSIEAPAPSAATPEREVPTTETQGLPETRRSRVPAARRGRKKSLPLQGHGPGHPTDSPPSWARKIPLFIFIALAALLVARSMMPPAEYDVREYHLQAPKEWSQAGKIAFMPHNIYANMPMAAEMHPLLAIDWWRWISDEREAWWWGALSGKLVMAVYSILMALILGQLVRRLRGTVDGWWTSVLVLSMPALVEGASLGLIEGAVGCFFAAALLVVVAAWKSRSGRIALQSAAWLGFFAGAAMACKYPALLFVALPLGLVCWFAGNERLWSARSLRIGYFVLFAAIACAPWYLKNAVLAGNPVYPLAASVFGGETLTQSKITQWNEAHDPDGFGANALIASAKRLSWQSKTQSMILVPLALIGAVATWREKPTRWTLAGLALTLLLWWLLTHRIERFLVPSLPLVFLLAGLGWSSLRENFGIRVATLVALMGVGMDSMLVAGPLLGDSRLAVDLAALRLDEPAGDRPSRLPDHVRFVNENLSPNDHVLLVGDAAAFDYAIPVDYSTTFDESPLAQVIASGGPDVWSEELRRRNYSHVLVHWGEIERLRSTYGFDPRINRDLFSEMKAAGVVELERNDLTGGAVELYRVTEGADGVDRDE